MVQVLVQLDDDTARALERVAPGKSRSRSEFIRAAIRKALWELAEAATAAAYRQQPDSAADAYFEPRAWEAPAPRRRASPKVRRRKR